MNLEQQYPYFAQMTVGDFYTRGLLAALHSKQLIVCQLSLLGQPDGVKHYLLFALQHGIVHRILDVAPFWDTGYTIKVERGGSSGVDAAFPVYVFSRFPIEGTA